MSTRFDITVRGLRQLAGRGAVRSGVDPTVQAAKLEQIERRTQLLVIKTEQLRERERRTRVAPLAATGEDSRRAELTASGDAYERVLAGLDREFPVGGG